jgi:putative cell wall-binding protein
MSATNTSREHRRRGFARLIGVALAALTVAAGLVAVQPAQQSQALSGSDFNAGYIIADSKFYDGNAMSQAQIQAFLNAKIGTCSNTYCLNVYRMDTTSKAAEQYCAAYAGAAAEPVATIIYKVQKACKISARVILVTLQKEQGLVTSTGPSLAVLRKAMGMGCPDTSVCDSQYYGFFNQVYAAARQFNRYGNGSFTYLKLGQVSQVRWFPLPKTGPDLCGAGPVIIQNRATAALYYYTPYQPNRAALANLSATGDSCSAYGNRNFWIYYTNFFGSPNGDPMGAVQSLAAANNAVTVSGWAVDPDVPGTSITIRVRGSNWSQLIAANLTSTDSNSAFVGSGTMHGFSASVYVPVGQQNVCVDAVNQSIGKDVTLGCSTLAVPSSVTVSRTAGTDRYATAAQISAENYAKGVPVAYVASGQNFPDALSAVPAAASQGAPVLLVTSGVIPAPVETELVRLAPQKIVIVGGTGVISQTVAARLAALVPTAPIERIGGRDRWETSRLVGEVLGAARSGRAYIVSGRNFPDALSAASAAGVQDSPVLLVDGLTAAVPAALSAALQRWGVSNLTLVGGTGVISAALEEQLRTTVPGIASITRLSGADRFATSAAVNAAVFGSATSGYVSNGYAFPDSLGGGAVAGRNAAPLYLAKSGCLPQAAIAHFQQAGETHLTLLGGTGALGPDLDVLTPCR